MEAGRVWGAERKPCQFESGHTDHRGRSSVGRAFALQAKCQGFKSPRFHHLNIISPTTCGAFLYEDDYEKFS